LTAKLRNVAARTGTVVFAGLLGTALCFGYAVAVAGARTRGPRPAWKGDFSTGNFDQYQYLDGLAGDRALVSSPLPPGDRSSRYAFEATVEAGTASVWGGEDGERSMVGLLPDHNTSRARQGQDTWYRDEIYFPASFQPTARSAWNWLYELHDFPNAPCCANLALSVVTDASDGGRAGRMRLSLRLMGGGAPIHPIEGRYCRRYAGCAAGAYWNPAAVTRWIRGPGLRRGRWYDFVWHVHWDWRSQASGGRGGVEYYIDGRRIGTYRGPTLFYYADDGTGHPGPGEAYLEEGFYRPVDSQAGYSQPTVQVYHAESMLGPSAASIGEAQLTR
jgi:polysaccharide lyase-like protein